MPRRVGFLGFLVGAACSGTPEQTASADPASPVEGAPAAADLIFHDARIYVVEPGGTWASAVAVDDGKIVAVGTDKEVLKHRDDQTRVVDLDGALVLPGFNDNHVHFDSAAQFLEFNVMKAGSQEDFRGALESVLDGLPEGEWILGGFWGAYDQWTEATAGGASREPFTPDMPAVAELTAKHPVFIQKFDGSEYAVNEAALRAAGVNPNKPRAKGVKFEKKKGQYTGILHGDGVKKLFAGVVPESFSHDRRVRQTKNALDEIRRRGVTNVSDMSDDEQLAIYRELHAAGELTVRVHFRYFLDRWPELKAQGIKVGSGDAFIRLGSLKGHIDGIMGSSSARFFEPYTHDPKNRGKWRKLMVDDEGKFVEGKFLGHMLGADAAGLQLTVHAIGDEANHLLLNYLEEVVKKNGKRDRRFRLVHAQVMDRRDFPRLGELDVVAEVQPFHLSDDMRWMEERIGPERVKGAYAFRDIVDGGAVLCFGSDWPGTAAAEYPIDPLRGLYAAVARQTTAGEPKGGWFPDQRLTIEEAVRAYTWGTAYANFEEDTKGSVTVGKLADLTVLDRNILEVPPTELLRTKVLFTVVDGKVVYEGAGS